MYYFLRCIIIINVLLLLYIYYVWHFCNIYVSKLPISSEQICCKSIGGLWTNMFQKYRGIVNKYVLKVQIPNKHICSLGKNFERYILLQQICSHLPYTFAMYLFTHNFFSLNLRIFFCKFYFKKNSDKACKINIS